MELELHRVEEDAKVLPGRENKRTRGSLFMDGKLFISILEDEVRLDGKVDHKTAIPAGRYRILLTWSQKFGRNMPEIVKVPGFTGIRVHSGHDEVDTWGCPLTAGCFDKDGDIMGGTSRHAQQKFEDAVVPALVRNEEVWITITNDFLQV